MEGLGGGALAGEGLGCNACDVVGQGDRGGAEVAALLVIASSSLTAQIAELVLVIVHEGSALVNDELIGLQLPQERVDGHEWQADVVGHIVTRRVAAGHQVLENEGLDFRVGQTGLQKRFGFRRHEGVDKPGILRLLGDDFGFDVRSGHLLVQPGQQRVELLVFLLLVLWFGGAEGEEGIGWIDVAAGQFCQQVFVGRRSHGCDTSLESWEERYLNMKPSLWMRWGTQFLQAPGICDDMMSGA